MTVGTVLNGLRLRRRLSGLQPLAPAADPDAGAPEADAQADDADFLVVVAPRVVVDGATRRAGIAHARAEGLDVVDLVPRDLPAEAVLDLGRRVDTTSYRSAPLAPGAGALHAIVVHRDLWEGAGRQAPIADRAAFVRLTERLKQHAARSTDLAVAPRLRAVAPSLDDRLGQLEATYHGAFPLALAIPALRSSLLVAGTVVSPGWGSAAAAAYLAQPYLATSGGPLGRRLRPGLGPLVDRLVEPLALLRAARTWSRPRQDEDPIEARRPGYRSELADGIDRFFEPRRTSCPWCGATDLVERVRVGDLLQYKPGQFVVEECRGCGLLFQNPRLTLDGLDFYYRDFYDGLGKGQAEFLFANSEQTYRGRVNLVRRHVPARAWLDVGTGYGHFCLIARGMLPETQFDGLDMGTSVEDGQRRGWLDHGFRGLFPNLADELKGRYDVVSMHHYLEHTRDPKAELEAAHTVLEPGGHLLIEVPDPESRVARLIGRNWVPWFQPQHQQFVPVANLCAALEERGFSIVEVERGPAHLPIDLGGGLWTWAQGLAPPPRLPWRDDPTAGQRLLRGAILATLVPAALLGVVADRVLQPLIATRAQQWSNTYRVLARRL